MLGPFFARRAGLAAEPLLAASEPALCRAYAARRQLRVGATLVILAIAITYKTLLAAMLGWRFEPSVALALLGVASVVLAVVGVGVALHDRRLGRRIGALQADTADRTE